MNYNKYIKEQIADRCYDCNMLNGALCTKHINTYCSELFLCEQCYKKDRKEVQGKHRYDSLVLCDEHNKAMDDIMAKLQTVLDNPNVTVIKDLGL